MAEIIDQIVKISIQDAISSVTTVDVNTVALVGLATTSTPVAGEIASVADAVTAYGENSELTAMVKAFFAQDSQPSRVVCIPAGNTAAATLAAVQAAAQDFSFYHVVWATWDGAVTTTILTGSNGWQEWLADVKKVLHVQVKDPTSLKNHGGKRIAVYKHDEIKKITQTVTSGTTTTVTHPSSLPGGWTDGNLRTSTTESGTTTTVEVSVEFLQVAIVALRCASDSARGTFAHKKCNGVTPDSYTVGQYNAWIDGGVNIYVKVSGEARLFMGTTAEIANAAESELIPLMKDANGTFTFTIEINALDEAFSCATLSLAFAKPMREFSVTIPSPRAHRTHTAPKTTNGMRFMLRARSMSSCGMRSREIAA